MNVNDPQELAAHYAAKEKELDAIDAGSFARQAVLCLRAVFGTFPSSDRRNLIKAYSGDGWVGEHFFGGMSIRNLLRRAGLKDDRLPDKNWDDYYRIVVRRALGIDPEPPHSKRIMSDDRLADWREFAASMGRVFTDDLDHNPQELLDHIDGLQDLLNLEVKLSLAGTDLRAEVEKMLCSTEVDCWETFEKAAQAYDEATGLTSEDWGDPSVDPRKIQRCSVRNDTEMSAGSHS